MNGAAPLNNQGNTGRTGGKDPSRMGEECGGKRGGEAGIRWERGQLGRMFQLNQRAGSPRSGSGLRLDYSAADGIPHQSGGFVNVEFFHDAGAMRFGGFYTQAQQRGYFLCGVAFRDQLQHLAFAST